MGLCPRCGAQLSFGAIFCGSCGARADGREMQDTRPDPRSTHSIFTSTEYTLQKRILAILTTFDIKDASGNIVARDKKEVVPVGPSYLVETPEGVRVGELKGAVALIPNRPYLEIRDAHGEPLAVMVMRVAKKPGAGFFSIGVTTWVIATPSGEELTKITCKKGGHDWTIETPDGTTIAEVHWKWLEVPRDTYQVKILNSTAIDPYFVLATVFGNPADRSNLA